MGPLARRWSRVAAIGGASGVAGWALENAISKMDGGPWRFSAAFGGTPVPFLPVYAVGGATIAAVAPAFRRSGLPWAFRGASYAVLLTALEVAGCAVDRKLLGARSWDYDDGAEPGPLGGCADARASLAFGAMGLLVERFAALE